MLLDEMERDPQFINLVVHVSDSAYEEQAEVSQRELID